MNKDRAHILDELERFHLGKLDEIRVKRGYTDLPPFITPKLKK
jgi:hypothetical protein